jgi:hypothetical protein
MTTPRVAVPAPKPSVRAHEFQERCDRDTPSPGGSKQKERTMNKQLTDQWQVALIWMRDVNLAAKERTPRGLLDRLASIEIAEYHLDKYFEMLEAQLTSHCRIDHTTRTDT